MIAPSKVAAILLAAGESRRFGDEDKLAQRYRGKPLVAHAARILASFPFARHIAVVSSAPRADIPPRFTQICNPDPARGLGASLALGVGEALQGEGSPISACLVMLGDMPLVPASHIQALLDVFDPEYPLSRVATQLAERTIVPAIFGAGHFPALMSLDGDEGARALLRGAPGVPCDPALLRDFDRPEDFAASA